MLFQDFEKVSLGQFDLLSLDLEKLVLGSSFYYPKNSKTSLGQFVLPSQDFEKLVLGRSFYYHKTSKS